MNVGNLTDKELHDEWIEEIEQPHKVGDTITLLNPRTGRLKVGVVTGFLVDFGDDFGLQEIT